MENYETIHHLTECLFQKKEIPESREYLITTMNEFLKQGLDFDAFLFARRGFIFHKDQEFRRVLEKTAKCKINDEFMLKINDSTEKELFSELFSHPETSLYDYDKMISFYIKKDYEHIRLMVFLLSEKNGASHPTNFIKRIMHVHSQFKGWRYNLWQMFSKVCLEADDSMITFFGEKIIMYGERDVLLSFYKYYTYLGDERISSLILNCLTAQVIDGKFNLSMFGDFVWPPTPLTTIQKKYEKVLDAQNGKRNLSELFENNSLISLVPLCLYAREIGDAETEAHILWQIMKRCKLSGVLERMTEITGFQFSETFRKKIAFENRGRWLSNRLQEAENMFKSKNINHKTIQVCKELFPVRPFDIAIIKVLLEISTTHEDEEVNLMLQYSIGKMHSKSTLGKLLSYAITSKSRHGLKLILSRILQLEHYSIILYSIDKVSSYIHTYDSTLRDLISETLLFYSEFVPINNQETRNCEAMRDKYGRMKVDKELFTKVEKNILKETVGVMDLFHKKQYEEIFDLLKEKKTTSPDILELILKYAMTSDVSAFIVMAYAKLAQVDRVRASFYNFEVEPYFLANNKNKSEKKSIGTGNLVSSVWTTPATLERPVNTTAWLVSGIDPLRRKSSK